MTALGVPAQRILFVDDREKTLDAARRLGISTVLFDPVNARTSSNHRRINRLGELSGLATSLEKAGLFS